MKLSNWTGGLDVAAGLTAAFLALKLTGYMDWSWWWVLSPPLVVLGLNGVAALVSLLRLADR